MVLGRVTIQSSSINVAAVEIRAAESPAVQFVASGSRLYWRLPGLERRPDCTNEVGSLSNELRS